MGLEGQNNNEAGQALGGNGASQTPDKQAATVLGTATRQPVFGQQQGQEAGGQDVATNTTQAVPAKGRQTVTLPPGALDERLNRAKAAAVAPWLKELGAANEAEAKQKLAELKKAGEEREKAKLAEMGEVERLNTQLQAANARIAELEAQLAAHEEAKEHEQHEQVVTRVAGEQIDPDALPLFKMHLAQHVKKLAQSNPELAEKFGERGIRRFAEKWAKEHPKFAKPSDTTTQTTTIAKPAAPAAKPATTQAAPVRRPVTTGAPQRKPAPTQVPASQGLVNGKTPRPGQPNSMTSQEVAAWAKQQGINYRPM